MASFLRNTFDNLVTNLNTTFNNHNSSGNSSSSNQNRSNRRTTRVPSSDTANSTSRTSNSGRPSDRPTASTLEEQVRVHRAPYSSNPNEQQASRSASQPPIGRNQAHRQTPSQQYNQNQPHYQQPYHSAQHNNPANMNSSTNTTCNNNINNSNNSAPIVEKLDISDVRDPQDINTLTTKQLKIILTRNCVDYKGVFEKEVLREKVMQLWIDCNERKHNQNRYNSHDGSQSAGYQSDDIDESQACKICMEREINCVLLECGHMLTCVTCGRKLAECPVCRQNVTRCVRTFKG